MGFIKQVRSCLNSDRMAAIKNSFPSSRKVSTLAQIFFKNTLLAGAGSIALTATAALAVRVITQAAEVSIGGEIMGLLGSATGAFGAIIAGIAQVGTKEQIEAGSIVGGITAGSLGIGLGIGLGGKVKLGGVGLIIGSAVGTGAGAAIAGISTAARKITARVRGNQRAVSLGMGLSLPVAIAATLLFAKNPTSLFSLMGRAGGIGALIGGACSLGSAS